MAKSPYLSGRLSEPSPLIMRLPTFWAIHCATAAASALRTAAAEAAVRSSAGLMTIRDGSPGSGR